MTNIPLKNLGKYLEENTLPTSTENFTEEELKSYYKKKNLLERKDKIFNFLTETCIAIDKLKMRGLNAEVKVDFDSIDDIKNEDIENFVFPSVFCF